MKVEENDVGVKGGMLVQWSKDNCKACGDCVTVCRPGALTLTESGLKLDSSKCLNCGRCVKNCPTGSWVGHPAYHVYFGGRFGNGSYPGQNLIPLIDNRESLIKALDAAIEFFATNGKPGQRFRAALETVGWDNLAKTLTKAISS
jgi:dissimilatory sulfite reductase (desulfoviridin) alpha/beta subunit